jgi:Rieske Fe-S protein
VAISVTVAFAAVTAVCTHEVCTINGISGSIYVCPCHGSQFSATGGVVQGPAARPLRHQQGAAQPDAATRGALVSWLTTSLDRAATAKPNPGRPYASNEPKSN